MTAPTSFAAADARSEHVEPLGPPPPSPELGAPLPEEAEVVPPHAPMTMARAATMTAMPVRGVLIGDERTRRGACCRERSSARHSVVPRGALHLSHVSTSAR